MKRIVKAIEPPDFSQWKNDDKMAHQPNWNRVPTPIKHMIHEFLMCEQGYICCYCESEVRKEDSHIEHYRPKKNRCFAHLQLDYSNLHCSCQRDRSPGEPLHCGHLKGNWFDANLLVSPLDPDCEARFMFTGTGDIFPRDDDLAAKETIVRLGLNLPKLIADRAAAVEALVDLSEADIRKLLTAGPDGRFLAFHTTIKQVLAT